MRRITRKPAAEAGLQDCVAHRCARHAVIDTVMASDASGTPDNLAECAYCVVDRVIEQLVAETIFPIVIAFEMAEGGLKLLGADRHPSTTALYRLLEALTEKAGENDFKVSAQKVLSDLSDTLLAKGPDDPQ